MRLGDTDNTGRFPPKPLASVTPCPAAQPIPWDSLDPLIKPWVRLLVDHGYKPTVSCQGGDGHAFHLPMIGIEHDEDMDKPGQLPLNWLLCQRGARGFEIHLVGEYQHGPVAAKKRWEIVFWQSPLPPPTGA